METPNPTRIYPCRPEDFHKDMVLIKWGEQMKVVYATEREVVIEYSDQTLAVVTREELTDYMNATRCKPGFLNKICEWINKLK